MRFSDQVAIVTGGGSGIGKVTAARLAAEGAAVVVADIDAELAASSAGELARAIGVRTDVTERASVAAMVDAAVTEFGRIDVLVNNAAVCTDVAFEEVTDAIWSRDVDVCLKGAFLCTQAVLPVLVGQGGGAIVNLSSVNAQTYAGNEAYSAAKAGILSLTRSIAARYGPRGVRCNAVVPGTIRTHAWDERLRAEPDRLERVARWYPLGRVGTPEDVSSAVLFLASADAAWITGTSLNVDGGLLAGNAVMAAEVSGV